MRLATFGPVTTRTVPADPARIARFEALSRAAKVARADRATGYVPR
jgi:hypothetical protein